MTSGVGGEITGADLVGLGGVEGRSMLGISGISRGKFLGVLRVWFSVVILCNARRRSLKIEEQKKVVEGRMMVIIRPSLMSPMNARKRDREFAL